MARGERKGAGIWSGVCGRRARRLLGRGRIGGSIKGWHGVELLLKLKSPLVIAEDVLGNVITSLDFIPGTYLLPHVTRVLGNGPEVRAAIAAGDIRVSAATVEIDGTRSLPMPMAWSRAKDEPPGNGPDGKGSICNHFAEQEDADKQYKPIRTGYVADRSGSRESGAGEKTPEFIRTRVDTVVRTHNTVEDEFQRPTEAVGGVYSYEAIKAGTMLRAVVRVRTSVAGLDSAWKANLAKGPIRLGRAAKAGYGEVELSTADGSKSPSAVESTEGHFTIWLVSDLLLRSGGLGAGTTEKILKRELEESLRLVSGTTVELNVAKTDRGAQEVYLRSRRIESWAGAWNLPRPSLIAIQAGSCARYEVMAGSVTADHLRKLQAEGLGERRAEGYGEIRINHRLLVEPHGGVHIGTKPKTNDRNRNDPVEAPLKDANFGDDDGKLPPELRDFVERVEDAAWRAAIADAALRFAADKARRERDLGWTTKGEQSAPPMSQLGALRTVMGDFAADGSAETRRWLGSVEENDRRKENWGVALVKMKTLLGDEKALVWSLLERTDDEGQRAGTKKRDVWPALLLRSEAGMKEAWCREAVQALILASIRAHKRDLERSRSRPNEHDAAPAADPAEMT